MAKVTVRVEGLRELEAALRQLSKRTGKAVLRRTLLKAAAPMAEHAQSLAPERSGQLKKSVGVGTKLTRRQRGLHRKFFRSDKAAYEVFVGASSAPQAHLREFGSDGFPMQPFMRPAWDLHKLATLDRIKTTLRAEIDRSARRAARKAARLAAKAARP